MNLPIGGVKNHTILECPRCQVPCIIPPGMILRIPGKTPRGYCHEIVNPTTGNIHKRG